MRVQSFWGGCNRIYCTESSLIAEVSLEGCSRIGTSGNDSASEQKCIGHGESELPRAERLNILLILTSGQ